MDDDVITLEKLKEMKLWAIQTQNWKEVKRLSKIIEIHTKLMQEREGEHHE